MFLRNIFQDFIDLSIFQYMFVAFAIYCIMLFIKRLVMPR